MEDSYTVHRRRKAAARRRDKTPEPSSRGLAKDPEDEDPEDAAHEVDETERKRAIMEKMVEDTERMEAETKSKTEEKGEKVKDNRPKVLKKKKKEEEGPKPSVEAAGDGKQKEEKSVKKKISEDQSILKVKKEVPGVAKDPSPMRNEEQPKVEESVRDDVTTVKKPEDEDSRVAKSGEREDTAEKTRKETKIKDTQGEVPARKEEEPEVPELPIKRRSWRESNGEEKPLEAEKSHSVKRETSEGLRKSLTSERISKKRIIPLSVESLIDDLDRVQMREMRYYREFERERNILDFQEYPVPEKVPRRRKLKVVQKDTSESDEGKEKLVQDQSPRWYQRLFSGFSRKKEKVEVEEKPPVRQEVVLEKDEAARRSFRDLFVEFRGFVDANPYQVRKICQLRNKCIADLVILIIFCGLGAFLFRFTEGAFETFYKCGVKRVKRDFLDSLWNYSHNLREDDWKSMARKKLMEFEEQLHTAHEAGLHSYSGQKSWTFLNAFVFCLTVVTTIGYGHISPSTTTGRAVTIIYAIFGIPIFLIVLADFGKLFTRAIKFLWAFVRRVYYTGSCRKVRRTAPVQEVMKGVQLVYDFATFRRPSQMNPEELEEIRRQQTTLNIDGNAPIHTGGTNTVPGTPGTPAMSTFEIDDEFNLPISVAIFVLLGYILIGATLYNLSERWGFFESFYFVFISMSTIGFGDFVPKHPIYMMCSIIYLVFGLALTSMCINVVQVMLSDSFKQASQKIGATIGFEVVEDGSVNPSQPPPVEVAEVHTVINNKLSSENITANIDAGKVPPKAKLDEDNDL